MDLQTLYKGIADFWDSISPVLFAHLFFLAAWIWAQGRSLNLNDGIERFLKSDTYAQWKKLLDEFDLMPKIPFALLILALFYLAIFKSFINAFAGGFGNPLTIVYSETDFWSETNDGGITSQILSLASYQKPGAHLWELSEAKETLLERYKTQNLGVFDIRVDWLNKQSGQWIAYYQLSLLLFAAFVVLLISGVRHRFKGLALKRVIVILVFLIACIGIARYEAEQSIEHSLQAELGFVVVSLQNDATMQSAKLNDTQLVQTACTLADDRLNYQSTTKSGPWHGDFWFSRFVENILPWARMFPRHSSSPWVSPSQCNT